MTASVIKAVFSDLDGTLLNAAHRVSPHTIAVLKKLKEKGIRFVVCTGRPYPDVFATLDKCGLEPDYIITSNGARVHDKNRGLIVEHNVAPEVVRALCRLTQQPNADGVVDAGCGPKRFYTNIHRNDEWLADATTEKLNGYFDACLPCQCIGERLFRLEGAELEGVHYGWLLGEPADLVPLERYIARNLADGLTTTFPIPLAIDFVAAGVNKGRAMTEVCALLGIPLAEVAAFGDGMNDLAMLKIAGRAFVMENGQDKLKAGVAHAEIIGPNTDDSVAKKLEEMFLS